MANERARGLGYKYITDDKYLVNPFSPTEGISYEGDGSPVSYANSMGGIMSQAPYIYPPINQGGGDGGDGGFTGPTGPGSYDSAFDPETQNKQFNEDIGVGTVAEEDDEETKGLSIMDMVRAGGAYMVGGPFNAISSLNKTNNRNKQEEIDKINEKINKQYGYNTQSNDGSGLNDGPDGGYTGSGNEGVSKSDPTHSDNYDMKNGGRAGYFFGGRVNYKAGGRTDAESQYGADSAGSYDSSQNQSGREQSYGGDNNPSFYEPKTSVFNNPEILSKETIIGDVPMGIGFDNSYGRYKATMDLEESLKEKGLEGGIEYNNNIGNFDLAAKYNTQDGPSYGAGYTGNNFDVGFNNKTGASANYSKDIFDGRGKITAGGTYNPDGTYNAEGKISFNYANGGLAGLI
jgi:hypothetical protein